MNRRFEQLISIILGICTLGLLTVFVGGIHREMTRESTYCVKLKKASYKDFKRAFRSVKWEVIPGYYDSLEGLGQSAYFHASIIRFGDVGYVMTTFGFLLATRMKNKKIKSLRYTKEWV